MVEALRARTLYSEGFIRQIWQRGDMPGACLLLEAADEVQVRAGLESLPLVAASMLEITNIVPCFRIGDSGRVSDWTGRRRSSSRPLVTSFSKAWAGN
jgi:hypothetical protein